MQNRPRVLIVAEAANPEWTSVPLIGWSLARALSGVADVHVATQIRNRDAFLRAGLTEGRDFTAIDSEAVTAPLWRLVEVLRMGQGRGWTLNTAIRALGYPYFERLVWNHFQADLQAGRFDLVHRITPVSPTAQSPIASKLGRIGVPFVLGPLNGGIPWPPGFDAERRREREWLSYVRSAYKVMPGRRASLHAAAAILAGSRHTASEMPAACQHKTVYLPENAVDPTRFTKVSAQSLAPPLRACFIGRMVPYKGPDMLLEGAADLLRRGDLTLEMIGDGPMRPALEAQARDLGLEGAVTFHGQLPHAEVQDVAARTNLLTFPSIREFGGGVVLEALAMGIVPVIVDYAGPAELVDEATAFTLPLGQRAEIVAALRAQLEALVRDPSALPAMGQAGRARVAEAYTWRAKAEQIRVVYDWVLSGAEGPAPQVI